MANTGVSGRVVDAVTKAGIAGLTVKAYDIDPFTIENHLGTATTGSDGRYTISYSPGNYRIWLTGEDPDVEVRVFGAGDRLLHETLKKDGVTDAVLPVPDIEIHASNIRVPDKTPDNVDERRQDPYWLVTHTTLNPASGTPIRLTSGNQLEWLVDGAAMFPAVNNDVRRGLKSDGKADEAATNPVKSIKLINMSFDEKLISDFKFPSNNPETVEETDVVKVDRLAKILKAQAKKEFSTPPPNPLPVPAPVHVLVWELEEGIGGDLGSRLNRFDSADELRKFFQDSGVQLGVFRSTQLLHVKFILLDSKTAYLVGSSMNQGYFGDDRHLIRDGRHGVQNPETKKGARQLLHDVSLKAEGPCVRFIEETFSTIWNAGNDNPPGLAKAVDPPDAPVAVQVLRTLPGNIFTKPHVNAEVLPPGETGILEAYQRAIMKAEEYIYIEDQYFNSQEIVNAIKARMIERSKLEVIIVLNPRPDIGGYHAHQTGLIKDLIDAGGANRVAVFTMWSCTSGASKLQIAPIYVHSKVAIIDDVWLAVGTANLDGASLNARQWRMILTGFIRELLDEGDFTAAMFILWFPLIVTVFLLGFVIPDVGPFMRDAARREFARFTQHANPNRERQPPRHPEINLIVYNGIAGQPATDRVVDLRNALWKEHLGATPPPVRPQGGWVAEWKLAATHLLTKIRNAASQQPPPVIPFEEKVLEWSSERDFEANLRAVGVPTKDIVLRSGGATMPFVVVELIK